MDFRSVTTGQSLGQQRLIPGLGLRLQLTEKHSPSPAQRNHSTDEKEDIQTDQNMPFQNYRSQTMTSAALQCILLLLYAI